MPDATPCGDVKRAGLLHDRCPEATEVPGGRPWKTEQPQAAGEGER
jgi:hypothetical protein